MTTTEVVKELGINRKGTFSRNGSYVIDLEDSSDDYGKVYSLLDKNPDVDYMEDNSLLTVDNGSMYYRYEDYMINLVGDFKNNHYKVVISEVKGNGNCYRL